MALTDEGNRERKPRTRRTRWPMAMGCVFWSIRAGQNSGAGAIGSRQGETDGAGEYPLVSSQGSTRSSLCSRKKLAAGIDPMAERKAEAESQAAGSRSTEREAENSFEKVARNWWDWWAAGKSPRHTEYVMRRLEADVFPAFGHMFIDDVTPADIRKLMLAIENAGQEMLLNAHTRPQARSFAMRSPMASPAGTRQPISNPRIFWPKPKKRTSREWTPKNCPSC